jgi:hypothetical protein
MHRVVMLLVATACLIGVCMAEPQPVDGGWHRSDEVPVETPTATPPDGEINTTEISYLHVKSNIPISEPYYINTTDTAERRADVGGLVAVGLCGLLALTALWCCLRWGRAKR